MNNLLFSGFIAFIFSMILTAPAKADFIYVDPPMFMTAEMPDVIKCRVLSDDLRQVACADYRFPGTMTTKVQDTYTGRQWMHSEVVHLQFRCTDLGCRVFPSREPRGRITGHPDGLLMDGVLQQGYYVYANWKVTADNPPVAYKLGTGPLANEFPAYVVLNHHKLPNYQEKVYPANCTTWRDTCTITVDGKSLKVTRDQLPAYIPIVHHVPAHRCMMEFCYNSDQDVIGLNPDYHLWN